MKRVIMRFFLLCVTLFTFNIQMAFGQFCDTITNFDLANYTPVLYSTPAPGWGYVSGHNSFGDIAKADYYNYIGTNTHVTGAAFGFAYAFTLSPSAVVTATVWDGAGGTPGPVLGQKDILIADILAAIFAGQLTTVEFDTPIPLTSNEFFLGFTMTAGADTVGLLTSSLGDVPAGFGTAWELQANNTWYNYNDTTNSWGFDATHTIIPILTSPPVASFSPSNATGCIGSAVTYNATASQNATAYLWTFPGGMPSTSTSPNPQVTYNTTGTYDVTLVVTNGCLVDTLTQTNMVDIVNYCPSTCDLVSIAASNPVSCFGGNDGFAYTIDSGGTGPYTYQWGTLPVQTTDTAVGLAAGTYAVTITDQTGCFVITNVTVGSPTQLTVSASSTNPTFCNGNDGTAMVVTMGGTAPYSYNWSGVSAQNANITGLSEGVYMVTVTDANGCTAQSSVTISDGCSNCVLAVTASATNTSCGLTNGTATANVTGAVGAVSYLWSTSATTQMITGLDVGTYSVTITDSQGCVANASVAVVSAGTIALNITPKDNFCALNAAEATVTVAGGAIPYSFLWSASANSQTTATATGLGTGSHSVTVTDANGCSSSSSVAITSISNGPVLNTTQTNVSCNGGADGTINMTINSGNGPFSIFWTPLNISSQNLMSLPPNTYTATVIDQAGCLASTSVVISEPGELVVSASSTPTNGSDGTASANIDGGTPPFTYLWNNNDTSQTIMRLVAGDYMVTVTDANGCTGEGEVFVQPFTGTITLESLTNFDLYPNPTTGQFMVDLEFEERTDIQLGIFNLLGQKVYEYHATERFFKLPIDITDAGLGAYFVIIETKKGRAIKRVLVTR